MTKNDFINAIQDATEVEISKKDLGQVLDTISSVVVDTLKKDKEEKITLPCLGTFKVKHVSERSGVAALAGGQKWTVPAHDEITFKISKSVKTLD